MLVCFEKFTGYGLRVGGAGAVASSGAGLDVLRALGGCSLVAVFVYIRLFTRGTTGVKTFWLWR
jgi:hypothetical protein